MDKKRDFISEGAKNFDDAFGIDSSPQSTTSQRVIDDGDIEDARRNPIDPDDFKDKLGMGASEDKRVPKKKLGNLNGNTVIVDRTPQGAFAPAHTLPQGPSSPKGLDMSHHGKPLSYDSRKKLEEFNLKKKKEEEKKKKNPTTVGGLGMGSMGGLGIKPKKSESDDSMETNFLSPGFGGSSKKGKKKVGQKGSTPVLSGSSLSSDPQREASSRHRSGKTLDGYGGSSPTGKSKVAPRRYLSSEPESDGKKSGPMFSLFPGFSEVSITGSAKKKKKTKAKAAFTTIALFLLLFMAAFSIMGELGQEEQRDRENNLGAAGIMSVIGGMEEEELAELIENSNQGQPESTSTTDDDKPVIDDDDGDGDTGRRVESDSESDLYAGESDGGGPSDVEGFSKRQIENYTVAYNAAVDEGLTEKGILNVMMVITTESRGWNLANDGSHSGLKGDQDPAALRESLDHPQSDGLPSDHGYGHGGDHGSVGIMQQQFPWWGTVDQLMDRDFATRKFIEEMKKFDYDSMPSGEAIQKVQRSFDPTGSNYTREEGVARSIMEAIEKDR